jgi:lysyl-tRNA synthetase class 2
MARVRRRHLAMQAARSYFNGAGFLEIDSPHLIRANCVEAHIDPIAVKVEIGQSRDPLSRYLHTSPEIYHKRLLSYGLEKIYQLSHAYRDGELGRLHLPEFSLLEWYRSGGSLNDLIADCEHLIGDLAIAVTGSKVISCHDGSQIDLSRPFERATLEELWRDHASIDLRAALEQIAAGDDLALARAARRAGSDLRAGADFDDVFHHIMITRIEPKIGQNRPCVVTRWPRQMASLSRICPEDNLFAERFEIYCQGIEIANAYEELTDHHEQLRRFENDANIRLALGKKPFPVDDTFISDLSYMDPAAGIALGFDRVLMLILGERTISSVLALPWE